MHERRFDGDIARLRSPERMERLEIGRVIATCLAGGPVRSVLDVGTGSGVFAEHFAQSVETVVGIDANADMVKTSKELVPHASFQQATAEALPFGDKSFDIVFLGLVLHETDDLRKTLQESKRCATRGVVALEWPYVEQEAGPPLEHRLKQEDVVAMAKSVGYKTVIVTALRELVLYQMMV